MIKRNGNKNLNKRDCEKLITNIYITEIFELYDDDNDGNINLNDFKEILKEKSQGKKKAF